MPFDVSVGNQLSAYPYFTPVLLITQAYPHLTAKFETAKQRIGHSCLDHEPNVEWPTYSTGTAEVVDSVVTITGGTIPSPWPNFMGSIFEVGDTEHLIDNVTTDTTMTLFDVGVNYPAGTSYVIRHLSHRWLDPRYGNMAQITQAHEEYAAPIDAVREEAKSRGARIGFYDFACIIHTNQQRILDNPAGQLADWQGDQGDVLAIEALPSGETLADIIRTMGGYLYWTAYVPVEFSDTPTNKARWRTVVRRCAETLRANGVLNVPLLWPYLIGDGSTAAPADLIQGIIADMEEDQPGMWGVYGDTGEITQDFIDILQIPFIGGGTAAAPTRMPAAFSAAFSPASTTTAYLEHIGV